MRSLDVATDDPSAAPSLVSFWRSPRRRASSASLLANRRGWSGRVSHQVEHCFRRSSIPPKSRSMHLDFPNVPGARTTDVVARRSRPSKFAARTQPSTVTRASPGTKAGSSKGPVSSRFRSSGHPAGTRVYSQTLVNTTAVSWNQILDVVPSRALPGMMKRFWVSRGAAAPNSASEGHTGDRAPRVRQLPVPAVRVTYPSRSIQLGSVVSPSTTPSETSTVGGLLVVFWNGRSTTSRRGSRRDRGRCLRAAGRRSYPSSGGQARTGHSNSQPGART